MIIDLSSPIYSNMPHYPDDIDVKVESFNYEYFNITNINMCVHSGTHIDTPLHGINNKPSTENIDLNYFIGSAYCIDIKADKENKINFPHNFDFGTIKGYDILLINTSWHKNINTDNYYKDFPYLSESFAYKLLDLKIKTIGIDSPSVDNINNNLIHNILFSHDICIIEGLANLDKVSNKEFFFSAAPLKIRGSEGSPVRVYAVIE
ncbi:cyclase family protein [Brachyspira murdochii]|uniref:Cyclase n=1 Tax=Brachyspira murdochii TaxID=84378 RepID=A0ABX5B7A5_9SPIR|nr:cyclase family protein [Brachyspira murdochii]PPS22497.1 cyclase [Brachyspira murdochii]